MHRGDMTINKLTRERANKRQRESDKCMRRVSASYIPSLGSWHAVHSDWRLCSHKSALNLVNHTFLSLGSVGPSADSVVFLSSAGSESVGVKGGGVVKEVEPRRE